MTKNDKAELTAYISFWATLIMSQIKPISIFSLILFIFSLFSLYSYFLIRHYNK